VHFLNPSLDDEPAPPLSMSWCVEKTFMKPPKEGMGKCEDMHEDAECVFNCIDSFDYFCAWGLCDENDQAPDREGPRQNDRCACKVPMDE